MWFALRLAFRLRVYLIYFAGGFWKFRYLEKKKRYLELIRMGENGDEKKNDKSPQASSTQLGCGETILEIMA